MKTVVIKTICSGCLEDRNCVGDGTHQSNWYCEQCAKAREFKNKADALIQAGWAPANEKNEHTFEIETCVTIRRTYKVVAASEDEARELYTEGDAEMTDEDEDFEEVETVRVVTDDH